MGRLVACLTLCLLAGGGLAGVAAAQQRPPLEAVLQECASGPEPDDRMAEFSGSMPARSGAARMSMRFDLQRRALPEKGRPRRWRTVTGLEGFRTWERSEPNRAGFVFHKRVDALRPDAEYRAVVRFRWHASDGSTVRRARRHTRVCRQPELRPDLAPGALTATRLAAPGLLRYTLVLRNRGRSDADPFRVSVAGVRVVAPGLDSDRTRPVDVIAPACVPGTRVAVTVDTDDEVDEAREDDTVTTAPCPPVAL